MVFRVLNRNEIFFPLQILFPFVVIGHDQKFSIRCQDDPKRVHANLRVLSLRRFHDPTVGQNSMEVVRVPCVREFLWTGEKLRAGVFLHRLRRAGNGTSKRAPISLK